MAKTQIGAQMFTLRQYTQTPDDIARTFERVKAMGYDAVQCSALGPIDSESLARCLRDNALTCAATHVSLDQLKQTQACLDHHAALACSYTAIGGAGHHPDWSANDWIAFARQLSAAAQPLEAAGLHVGYHNHSHELAMHDGRRPLDILANHCDPVVWLEVDTYWIAHGGGDPAVWIDRIATTGPDRVPCVHAKDMAITPTGEQVMAEVGAGNLHWPAILEACKNAGTQWYLVERDRGPTEAFESLRISLENLKAMGLR